MLALIDEYATEFSAFGALAFETEVRAGQEKSGGGLLARFAMLNEDQSVFLLTLARNSPLVVELKVKLVQAFKAARATVVPSLPASPLALMRMTLEQLEAQDSRLSAVESRFENLPVSGAAKGEIHARVTRLALLMGGKPSHYSAAWRAFKDRYGLAAYGDLPARLQPEALRFVDGLIAAYAPANVLLEASA